MWKNLKGYFIVEEPGKGAGTKTKLPDKQPKSTTSAPAAPPAASSSAAAPVTGRVSGKFEDALLQAMERANLPGFDYLEYKKSLQNLQKMNFDEAMRFQTAYAAAQSMGVTPQQLTESAAHYLQALKTEQDKFTAAVQKQQDDQVGSKQNELKRLDALVSEQEAKIAALQEQIAKTRTRQQQLQQTIGESRQKIQATAADFRKTYDTITGSITADIEKMRQYLK
ncbi:hypothetical protein LEM8419_00014 [Neolewinella maritima]|uniref:Uncharacterized protein n=1 Tax=Neolewinella maritima TaxID=1383882 RepID=A0ABM9AVK9_9BACT|nr:hypothetical protein [Neolewinella maritima]CAH0998669.1 hypothetical protein LEM8419_00014 [Neolewinella maritima]